MHRLAFTCCLLLATTTALAQDDATFLHGLRRLQLFDLAERYCRQEMSGQPTAERQAKLTIELIRSLAMHAMSQPPAERDALWAEARQVARDFERQHADHPQLFLIRVQDALTLLAQGELAAQEAEAAHADAQAMQQAAEQLRAAAKLLDDIQSALEKEIAARRGRTVRDEELSAEELQRLQMNVGLQLAKARRAQAMCYPAESRDRKALLLATLDALERAVAKLDAADELAGQMRVAQMAVLRQLGRLQDAQRIWPLIENDDMPGEIRRAGLAEAARLLVAAGQPEKAIAMLDNDRFAAFASTADPELDLARLEAILAAAKKAAEAKNDNEQTKLQRLAAALAQRIDQQHGRAWGRRADQLVTSLVPSDAMVGNVDLLARVADNLYVKQQIDEALAAYDKAAEAARASGDQKREFELRYKAGLVEQQRKQFAAASARFERLAIELKDYAQAPEAHLLACWNKAQQARNDQAATSAYVQMLEEHLQRFPNAATTDQVRLWLGGWHQSRRAWSQAFAAYSGMREDAKDLPAAIANAAFCARSELAELREKDKLTEQSAKTAIQFFQQVAQSQEAAVEARQQSALFAAELLMEHVAGGHAPAERLLKDALKTWPEADDAWRSDASSLLAAAVAGQAGRRGEAQQMLADVGDDPAKLLALLERLAATSQRASQRTRVDLAQLELDVIERLKPQASRLSSAQQQLLAQLRAAALATAGERDKALAEYAALAKASPNSGAIQEAYAELLAQGDDKASHEAALAKWRWIAAKSPPRTERWWKAKYAVAELQKKLGDASSAATLCRYLLETPRGIDDAEWKTRFEQLLRSCRR
jgi:hypothetical protein